jgi:hypothetical protein
LPVVRFHLGVPGGNEENHENLQDNRCRNRDSNQALPKYKSDPSDTRQYWVYFEGVFKEVTNFWTPPNGGKF